MKENDLDDAKICPTCGKNVIKGDLTCCRNPIHIFPPERPPYSCPKSVYNEGHKCTYPNCGCQWFL